MSKPFERIKFVRETESGAGGKCQVEAHCWGRNTKCTREHAAPDFRGFGSGETLEEARKDAVSHAVAQMAELRDSRS